MSRDQSEDRTPPGGLYPVVGYEHPRYGTVFYVQHPNGKRLTLYTKSAAVATKWAATHESKRTPYSPESDTLSTVLPPPPPGNRVSVAVLESDELRTDLITEKQFPDLDSAFAWIKSMGLAGVFYTIDAIKD